MLVGSRRKPRVPMARSVPGTLDRRDNRDMSLDSCDMDTMPLTPASFGGLDHKVGLGDRVQFHKCATPQLKKQLVGTRCSAYAFSRTVHSDYPVRVMQQMQPGMITVAKHTYTCKQSGYETKSLSQKVFATIRRFIRTKFLRTP